MIPNLGWLRSRDNAFDFARNSVQFKNGHSRQGCSTPLGPTTGLVPPIQAYPFRWVIHEGSETRYQSLRFPLLLLLTFKTRPLPRSAD
ncbi:hypothetical protein AVEN_138971-1 [Araneus ventricosus]|uniref:Uncharacterized protein n=1 Tax=Araneus ventricosus TaxID=182803 RepID=A0A4Y2V8X3_ARAVE|nr:hypothetical protein AVEN_138971-1 [Araneus ventricosus]